MTEHEEKPLLLPQDLVRPFFVSWIWSSKFCWFNVSLTLSFKVWFGSVSHSNQTDCGKRVTAKRTKKNPVMTCNNSEASQITQVTPGVDLLGTPDRPTVIAGVRCWWAPWPRAPCFLVGPSVSPSVPRSLSQYLHNRSSGGLEREGVIFLPDF